MRKLHRLLLFRLLLLRRRLKMETGYMLAIYFFVWVAFLFGVNYANEWLPLVFLVMHFFYGVSQRVIGMKEE